MGSTIQGDGFLHVAADLRLKAFLRSFQGGVLGSQAEVQALHKPLPLDMLSQAMQLVGQLVGHEIDVMRLIAERQPALQRNASASKAHR